VTPLVPLCGNGWMVHCEGIDAFPHQLAGPMLGRFAFTLVIAPVLGMPIPLRAQFRPPPERCSMWSTAIAAGGRAALAALTEGWIGGCTAEAPAVVSAAIAAARTSRDTVYLHALGRQAQDVRDVAVFTAALTLAGDTHATEPSRVMAVMTIAARRESAV